MKGWTMGCVRRDRRRWPYAMMLSDQNGDLIIETVHGSKASLQAEVQASASRIAQAQPNRGGQIPTTVDVDGLAPDEWRQWLWARMPQPSNYVVVRPEGDSDGGQ